MAKKTDKRTAYLAYVDELLATVPEDKRDTFRAAYTDEAVIDKNADAHFRQSDYSRHMDAVAQREREAEEFIASQRKTVEDWRTYAEDAMTRASQTDEALKRYEAVYGKIDPATPPSALKREDIEALMESKLGGARKGLDEWLVQSVDALTDLKIEHRDRFKEKLDTTELSKFAKERGYTTLDAAYTAFVAPKVDEAREADFKLKMDEAVKQAREEGRKAAVTERFPGAGGSHNIAPVVPKDAVVRNSEDRVARAAHTLETLMAGR